MIDDDEPMGETVELLDEVSDVEDTDDGGAIVRIGDAEPEDRDWFDNLAEDAPEHELNHLATNLLDLIDRDKSARKRRDEQQEEGLRRTGLGNDAPGGASFEGASKVVHPMLTEACVDFSSRAMKELFPPQGPVKDRIDGKVTQEKLAKAHRKTRLMNWQLTVQCKEFRAELEQLMTQVPMGGAQYLKLSWNKKRNRPEPLFVAIDEMYLPFAATNFYSSQRRTHVQYLTALEYQQRVKSGMYRDVDLVSPGMEPDMSESSQANDKIEGRDATSYNEDGLRTVYEVYVTLDLDLDDKSKDAAPYIVTVDLPSGKVLSIYRNWEEDDEGQTELQWFVEFPFIPWRGAYPIGLPQMIGGLSGSATGALRALLDSAHIQNSQTMVKLKSHVNGQSATLQPGTTTELEGGVNIDDVRKLAMPVPYNQPSPVLFQLLGFLVETGKGVVRTSLDDTPDAMAQNAPVGTTLAHIEQGLVVYSAVHGRLHDAMGRLLGILNRLNARNLDDEALEREAGEALATREDFQGPLDVVPVSDPNIFSETQRVAQVQAVAQRSAAMPQLYNLRKVEERILETLKIPNPTDLLAPALEPKEQNAVNENVAASLGRPVTAFPEQDHVAHLKTHITYLLSPMFGGNPLIAPAFLPAILGHLREHIALWYAQAVFDVTSEAIGMDLGDLMKEMNEEKDVEARQALDRMLAESGTLAVQDGTDAFAALPPIIAQAQQLLQQFTPQQPDPLVALEQQKIAQKGQADQMAHQRASQKMQLDAQSDQQALQVRVQEFQSKLGFDYSRLQAEQQAKQEALRAGVHNNEADNATALIIAREREANEPPAFDFDPGY